MASRSKIKIIINDDSYIVQHGSDRIVLPKEFPEARRRITNEPQIKKHIARTFEVLQDDLSVTDFGFAAHIHDRHPLAVVPQSQFALLADSSVDESDTDLRRVDDERANVVVIKAVFERGGRKWQFAWNGVKISAPIRSDAFFDKMARREYEFGQGDVLDVTLRITRVRDEMSGAFINEKYEIIEVHGHEKAPSQLKMLP